MGQKILIAPREASTNTLLSTAKPMWTTLVLNPNIWGVNIAETERQVFSVWKRQFFFCGKIHSEPSSVPGLRDAEGDAETYFISDDCV